MVIHATSKCSSYTLAPKNQEHYEKNYAKYSLRQTGQHTGQYILFFLMAILGKKKQEQNSLQYLVNYLLGSYNLYASTNY